MASDAARSAPAAGPRWLSALAPRGWPHFFLQVAALGGFAVFYALSGIYARHQTQLAYLNSWDLVRLERHLGIYWEHPVQSWVLGGPGVLRDVANFTYFGCQFAVSTIFLLWAYARRNEHFARIRDALLAANVVSLIVLFVFPVAPPRLLPGSGFVDTLTVNAVNLQSSLVDALNNPYAAMPSLHASYAIVLAVAGFTLARRPWVKLLWALYPGLVTYSIVASGNHFVLDVVAGAAALLATPAVSWAVSRAAAAWANRPDAVGEPARAMAVERQEALRR